MCFSCQEWFGIGTQTAFGLGLRSRACFVVEARFGIEVDASAGFVGGQWVVHVDELAVVDGRIFGHDFIFEDNLALDNRLIPAGDLIPNNGLILEHSVVFNGLVGIRVLFCGCREDDWDGEIQLGMVGDWGNMVKVLPEVVEHGIELNSSVGVG